MYQIAGLISPQDRVRRLTSEKVNRKIDRRVQQKIESICLQGPRALRARLHELDNEWDVDRVLMLNFSALVFVQLLAAMKSRKWLWGPLIQTPFLFMHATLGWCPPVLWFRRLGFRTRFEIQAEREALIREGFSRRIVPLH